MNTNSKTSFCIFAMILFFGAGCLETINPDIEIPDVSLPDDWSTVPSRSASSPQLQPFEDCTDLEIALKASIEEEYRIQLLQAVEEQYYYGGGIWLEDGAEMAMDDSATGAPSAGNSATSQPKRVEGEDFSGTNNQEAGVDEADFVKTNGYSIYYLRDQTLHIFAVPEFGEVQLEANLTIEGTTQSMMLQGDHVVVISTLSPWGLSANSPIIDAMNWDGAYGSWRTSTLTKFTVVDVAENDNPIVVRELYLEGYYLTARNVDGTVRTVSHSWMEVFGLKSWLELPDGYWRLDYDDPLRREVREKVAWNTILENRIALDYLTLDDLLPMMYEQVNGNVLTHRMSESDCSDFAMPSDGFNRGVSSIFSLNLLDESFSFQVDHVIGTYPQVYASQDVLVLAENAFDWWWFWGNDGMNEMTNLHTFDISEQGETLYTGSGRVNGTVVNQFALSEYEGILRVATTTGQWGRWWMDNPEPMSSQLVTLTRGIDVESGTQILTELGRVEGIAEGERIWSVRFDGDRAYVVTFEQIDPLWVIDLSDVSQPIILGELEVPGVSTYIHPLSEDAILTIGLGPRNADGTGLDWSSTQVSLFDVSDPTEPSLDEALRISPVENPYDDNWQWSWSEATYESKAFQYWGPQSMLAIPLSTYRYHSWYDGNNNYHWEYDYVSKLVLVKVNESSGDLTIYGSVDHSDLFSTYSNQYWWNDYNIRRSIFMGDYVYAISSGGITATNLTTMEESARATLDHPDRFDYGVYDDKTTTESSSEEDVAVAQSSSSDASEG